MKRLIIDCKGRPSPADSLVLEDKAALSALFRFAQEGI